MPLVVVVERLRQRQVDLREYEASLIYIVSMGLPEILKNTLAQKIDG